MIDVRNQITLRRGRFHLTASQVIGLAVHHTVTTQGAESEVQHLKNIDAYHVSQGWGGFGYHMATFPSGSLYLCGDLDGARAHVASRNHELLGIVNVGDFSQNFMGPPQQAALVEGVRFIFAGIGKDLIIKRHREWALPQYPTSCPGTVDVEALISALSQEDDMTPAECKQAMKELLTDANAFPELGGKSLIQQVQESDNWVLRSIGVALDKAAEDLKAK